MLVVVCGQQYKSMHFLFIKIILIETSLTEALIACGLETLTQVGEVIMQIQNLRDNNKNNNIPE